MEQFIGCDAHKKFSLFVAMNERGEYGPAVRVSHERQSMRRFLESLAAGSKIALETSGSYYWLVDEMKRAGHEAQLAHALTAKRRMEGRHKTDRKDAQGLAMLLRNGTLPRVWIPPQELRDQREMLRLRMTLVGMRTQIKNRIHGVLMRYNLVIPATDLYGQQGRKQLAERLTELPPYSRQSVYEQLEMLDFLEMQIEDCERMLEQILEPNVQRELLKTLPGVGPILSAVIALETGEVQRFPDAEHFVSYAGLVPTARESAQRKRRSRCPEDCNVYLRWAFVEAANVVACQRARWTQAHVVKLYQRVRAKSQLHAKAVVAVGRHLAEAAYWILRKQQAYRAPGSHRSAASSTHG
jgi:transposase